MSSSIRKLSLKKIVGGGYTAFWRFEGRYRVVKGSRASKKSATIALNIITRMMKYPLANTLVVRKTGNTLYNSCFQQLKWAIHRLGVDSLWKTKVNPMEIIYIPTGQKIILRGLDDPYKLTSVTVDIGVLCWVWLEECSEINDEEAFNRVDESIRGAVPPGYFKQITISMNPWSSAHFVKRRFFDIVDDPDILAITTNYLCNEFLDEADKRMFERMKRDDPDRYKVAGLGDWGIDGGQFFKQWRDGLHVIKPFKIPTNWTKWRVMDWGSSRPYACYWIAVDYDGNAYVYRELYGYGGKPNVGTGETTVEVAKKIIESEPIDEEIYKAVLDSACWAKIGVAGKDDTSVSIADQINDVLYNANRERFSPCKKGREHGAEEFRRRLEGTFDKNGNQKPAIYFFSNCVHAIRTIPMLTFDEHDPEKYDTKGEDHSADATIYFCLENPYASERPLPPRKESKYNGGLPTDTTGWSA